jgi:hypothetical protein
LSHRFDIWKLRTSLTIDEATYLALDCDPYDNFRPVGWGALNKALIEAVRLHFKLYGSNDKKSLDIGTIIFKPTHCLDTYALEDSINGDTLLDTIQYKLWFRKNKFNCEFFSKEENTLEKQDKQFFSKHNTRLMNITNDVLSRYYGENYDPQDRDTIPSQAIVIDWLKDTYSLSGREAQAIDIITRPDIARSPKGKK